MFTINNLAYQGRFDDRFARSAGLHDYLPPPGDPLRIKAYCLIGLGIYHADIVSTVSPTYAREILTPEYGMGLEALLQRRRNSLSGIVNGIDYEQFDPATDRRIAANYDAHGLERKTLNKLALQRKAGLPVNADTPLVGMTARLDWQKGLDITAEALKSLLDETRVQFVLQGTGEDTYREPLKAMESQHPQKARMFFTLDFALAQQIYAGGDLFLMPSRFEPCGLSQRIAMPYGTIPVVRRTGGLAETVPDCSPDLSSGLGFVFDRYDAGELLAALRRALAAFPNREAWHRLMVRAMEADFSWKASLPKYEALYEAARRKVVKQSI